MWSPTHVQVTVHKAKNLLLKGKNGRNNPFVTIAIGKEKFQTSVKEKVEGELVSWQEQCELTIPKFGNVACIILTALHRNSLGIDEFLGMVTIPLSSFDVYERPKSKWYKLHGKVGKEKGKDKERGELEVRIAFTVKASSGSLIDLSKKEKQKSSLGNLPGLVGGSLLSLGSSDRKIGIKKFAKSIGQKVSRKKRDSDCGDGASESGSKEDLNLSPSSSNKVNLSNVDPGVISEDEDEFAFDNLSHKSSGSSLNINPALENLAGGEFLRHSKKGPPLKPPRATVGQEHALDEWEQKLYGKGDTLKRSPPGNEVQSRFEVSTEPVVHGFKDEGGGQVSDENLSATQSLDRIKLKPKMDIQLSVQNQKGLPPKAEINSYFKEKTERPFSAADPREVTKLSKKLKQLQPSKKTRDYDRVIVGEETKNMMEPPSKHTKEVLDKFAQKSRDDLIDMIIELQKSVHNSNSQLKELEDYLDQLLLKVMETTPRILQNPFISCKTQASFQKSFI